MKKIPPGFILPSAAFTIRKNRIRHYQLLDKKPEVGDLAYGRVRTLGHHSGIENGFGRIHAIHDGSRAVFVYGNRYAPDHFEGYLPEEMRLEADMLAHSGVIGTVRQKNSALKDPTKIRVLGYVCTEEGTVLNTRDFPLITPTRRAKEGNRRSPMVLVVGTSMNSGKSMAAAACCWALSATGYGVRGSKITGTASLKDILRMGDAGASVVNDFTYFGYPSTYMLAEEEVLRIFNDTDLKYANNPKNFWVVELADGILQRETAMLLESEEVKSRIHRLVFCASDALGCIGGLKLLQERFGLTPDAISGKCSSAPLARRELAAHADLPVFDNMERDLKQICEILL